MGICSSCDASNVATAKLILLDGRLQEFPYPVKASYVLVGDRTSFICNSDEMEFDDVVSAVEELQLGGLYFTLPVSKMSRRLQAEEMAMLAAKASLALTKRCRGGDGGRCRCRKKGANLPVVVRDRERDRAAEVGRRKTVGVPGGGVGGRGGRRKFEDRLGVIPE
ncbi:hypothetical protein MLD38_007728 [Melastoma candidum]|uniref:Uncharacterized protein n=1 Tax=Melastoma candidum TaxID=119954 RepID=A0ACB9RRN1_9MYRT|nr:hypothetical protein MLD38_007728 [Melastoma candidum]